MPVTTPPLILAMVVSAIDQMPPVTEVVSLKVSRSQVVVVAPVNTGAGALNTVSVAVLVALQPAPADRI